MLSHLARFSFFVVVIMFSFAVAFYVLFLGCYDEDVDIQEAHGSLENSMLTLFEAMLGTFEFHVLLNANDSCGRPNWANAFGVVLLVLYLVVMVILLLNLLIAVLSTAHAEVEKDANREFHLARSRAIQQNWTAVLEDRIPSPLNLFMPISGTFVDIVGYLFWWVFRDYFYRALERFPFCPESSVIPVHHIWERHCFSNFPLVLKTPVFVDSRAGVRSHLSTPIVAKMYVMPRWSLGPKIFHEQTLKSTCHMLPLGLQWSKNQNSGSGYNSQHLSILFLIPGRL